MLNSSERLVQRATQVITSGDDGIIAAVDAGEMSVGRAAQEISHRAEDVSPRGQTGLDEPRPGAQTEILCRMSAEDVVEKIDGLIRGGATQGKATKQLGIEKNLFGKLRYIVRLVGHDGLSDKHARIARQALTAVNATKQITPAYKSVETLVDRVWGDGRARRGRGTDRQKLARRHERFAHAVGIVLASCQAITGIDVPYLSETEIAEKGRDLRRAQANLRMFGQTLKGEDR